MGVFLSRTDLTAKVPQGRTESSVTVFENNANVRNAKAERPGDLFNRVSMIVRLFKDPPMKLRPGLQYI
jgi:hypothetical protein